MEQITNEAVVENKGGKRLAAGSGKRQAGGKRPLVITGVVLAVVIAAYVGLCAYANSLDVFYPNTFINNVDVAGLTVAQAADRLRQELPKQALDFYLPLANQPGDGVSAPEGGILYSDVPAATVTYGELGFTDALDYTIETEFVYRVGQHKSGFLAAGLEYLKNLFGMGGKMVCVLEPDETTFQKQIHALAEQFSQAPQDTSYEIGEDTVLMTKSLNGLQVKADALASAVHEIISLSNRQELQVEAHILPAKTLTAQEISDEVSGEMKNAGYDAATDAITPEQVGAEFDVDKAQKLLDSAEPGETVEVPAVIQRPAVTAEQLKAVLFRDVLGEARTQVKGTAARKANVKLSAATISGFVMNTGDVFSYNDVVGKRTAARGYQAAPAYVKGETVDEIGGGICQTSSTLYLACLRSNLEITERYAHRYVPSYITPGMDATVSWGGPDYKFTNNTDYPIRIVTVYEGGYLTVKLLGTKTDGITVKMTNEHLSTTPFEVVYEDDPTLAPGTEKVKTTPYTGHKYKTYRNLYDASGKLISSTYEATSDYKARNRVILKGPALPATEPDVPTGGGADIPADPGTETPAEPSTPPAETTAPEAETPPPILVVPEEPAA